MRLLVGFLAGVAMVIAGSAVAAEECDTRCRTYKSGHSYRLYPITAEKFCVTFDQGMPDTVVLRLWYVDEPDKLVLNADWLRFHVQNIGHVTYAPKARPFGPTGRYCFRRARVTGGNLLVELCNGRASAYLPPAELAGMIADGLTSTPRGLNLRGKEP